MPCTCIGQRVSPITVRESCAIRQVTYEASGTHRSGNSAIGSGFQSSTERARPMAHNTVEDS